MGRRLILTALFALATSLFTPVSGPAGDCCPGPDLTIFFTSDTIGYLRRCGCSEGQMGGLSARASYIKEFGPKGKTLVLDAGDTFFAGLEVEDQKREFYALKAYTMAESMKAAGYGAAAVGEYDLAYGPGFLEEAVRDSGFPFLCANASWRDDGHVLRPFASSSVVEAGNVRVGVVGVLGAGFPYGDFKKNFGDISVSDPVAAAQREIDRLRPDVDLVVVLTHLPVESVEEMAAKLAGADIVIQGHSSEQMTAPEKAGGALLFKGYTMGKHMGRLDLWTERDKDRLKTGERLMGYEFSVVDLDESVPPDDEVEALISGYREKLKEKKFVFVKPEPEGASAFVGPEVCKGCHPGAYGNWSQTAHAGAFGILDKTGDQYDPECLPCHTTGYGYASGYRTGDGPELVNVTCESCHGRGAGHVAVKSGQAAGTEKDEISLEVTEDACRSCHDEDNSPYFDYEPYLEKGGAHGALTGR